MSFPPEADAHASTGFAEPREGPRSRSPRTTWPAWSAPLALVGGLVLAALAGLAVDLPALALGAHITSGRTSPGLVIADTFVQDVAFVVTAVYFAKLGGRVVRSWQFGLRAPGVSWWVAAGLVVALIVVFLGLSEAWSALFHPKEEKLLDQLGANEGATLLVLSAALTCVVAPIGEEMLFRGYVFTALGNWSGTLPAALITGVLFGAIHYGSAPTLDLVPLGMLGFGLCLVYRFTGSLYPSIAAHALNNSIAFAGLEKWSVAEALALALGALACIAAVATTATRVGLIARAPLSPQLDA